MQELAQKAISLDEQLSFVHDARHLLEQNSKTEIVWRADSIKHLRAIEESLLAVKMLGTLLKEDEKVEPCSLPVEHDVYVRITQPPLSDWISARIVGYEGTIPLVVTYYGSKHKIEHPSHIKSAISS